MLQKGRFGTMYISWSRQEEQRAQHDDVMWRVCCEKEKKGDSSIHIVFLPESRDDYYLIEMTMTRYWTLLLVLLSLATLHWTVATAAKEEDERDEHARRARHGIAPSRRSNSHRRMMTRSSSSSTPSLSSSTRPLFHQSQEQRPRRSPSRTTTTQTSEHRRPTAVRRHWQSIRRDFQRRIFGRSSSSTDDEEHDDENDENEITIGGGGGAIVVVDADEQDEKDYVDNHPTMMMLPASAACPENFVTIMAGTTLALGLVTAGQTLRTMVVGGGLIRHSVAAASLAPPAQLAWQEIGHVLQSLQAEPILRAWTQYPPHVVWQSLQAIRRLQHALPKHHRDDEPAAIQAENDHGPPPPPPPPPLPRLDASEREAIGKDLAYFSVYASLAYGWPMALARGLGKWRGGGNLQTLLQQTGLEATNVIEAVWQAEMHRPAYLLVQDPHQKAIVLSIRGTWSASDLLTDLCCSTSVLPPSSSSSSKSAINNATAALKQWFRSNRHSTLEAHHGMVQAAVALRDSLQHRVEAALKKHPDHRLVLVGHSMGGGAAALLGVLWQNVFDNPVVYVYGPPCVAPYESELTNHGSIHSVVLPGDPFCTLSLGHLIELAATVDYFGRHDALRRRICHRPVSGRYASEIWSLLEEQVWSKRRLQDENSTSSHVTKKLVPPGRLWRLVPQKKKKPRWKLQPAHTKQFLALSLQPFALDLTQHVPVLYESCLQSMYKR